MRKQDVNMRHARALTEEGAGHLRRDPGERGGAVRRRRAGPPHRAGLAQALLREGRRPLGGQGGQGASDPRSETRGAANRDRGETAGGVDVNGHTRAELYERAKKLAITGRSDMNKLELAQAIAKHQD